MDRVRNEEVCRRSGIGRELASGVDQRVWRDTHGENGSDTWREWMKAVWVEGC